MVQYNEEPSYLIPPAGGDHGRKATLLSRLVVRSWGRVAIRLVLILESSVIQGSSPVQKELRLPPPGQGRGEFGIPERP